MSVIDEKPSAPLKIFSVRGRNAARFPRVGEGSDDAKLHAFDNSASAD
jgi:hypothetical protein